jgi:hypothetical protein
MLRELAVAGALMLGVIEPPGPAPSPAAPQTSATPLPTATPKEPLREIGRVRAITSFCKAFITHFNNSAKLMIANDAEISYVDFTLGNLEKHFKQQVGGDLVLSDDRVKLMAYVKALQQQLPQLQEQINQLRRTAALTKDPEEAKQAREVATQLQKSYDRQHQIELDTLSVIHVMMEMAASKGEGPSSFTQMLAASTPTFATPVAPMVGAPSDISYVDTGPAERRDIRSYLRMQTQRDRIGDAESAATTKAEVVASNC